MNKGFNDNAFLTYLQNNFRGCENRFTIDMLLNILDYAHKWYHVSKDQFIWFLLDILPDEIEFGEIAQFANDEILTQNGIKEKYAYLKNMEAAENE